jgi:hypothetical protein
MTTKRGYSPAGLPVELKDTEAKNNVGVHFTTTGDGLDSYEGFTSRETWKALPNWTSPRGDNEFRFTPILNVK